jgi:pyruvate formate lyase activating enzyme
MDIKHLDNEKHKEATGGSNVTILRNALKLAETGISLLVRTPVIPFFNDTPEAIVAIAEYIHPFRNLFYYELLPFHGMAKGKYQSLGLENKAGSLQHPEQETLAALAQCAAEKGLVDVRTAFGIVIKNGSERG